MDLNSLHYGNIVLIVIALFIGFKYLETFWSYKISKPYAWEQALKAKKLNKRLLVMERSFRDRVRFYNLWLQIERLKKKSVAGAFAELGVHKGLTSKVIHLMDEHRKFYLFDTFEGFPSKDLKSENQTDSRFSDEMFADTSMDEVKAFISGNNQLEYVKGYFPDTSIGLENEQFALVHIDADLYAPTVAALEFFYPRLTPGGVIIVHDYNHNWDGIPMAVNEFITSIPESLIELADWQGSAMIIKNS